MNFDTVEVVIDRLISRFRIESWQYNFEDLIEDCAEGLKLIGAAKMYQEKSAELSVVSNTVALPSDHQHTKEVIPKDIYVRESGSFLEIDAEDGTIVTLVYQAMPVDVRGYPLVPDAPEVREALIWYMAKNLILGKSITSVSYSYAEAEWQWRCGSARAALNVLSVAQWAVVADNYTKLSTNSSSSDPNVSYLLDREKNRL